MPRPKKKGLDYFSLDCELDDKDWKAYLAWRKEQGLDSVGDS